MLDSSSQTDFEALNRALHWESAGRRPWRSYASSSAFHVLALLLSVVLTSGADVAGSNVPPLRTSIPFGPGAVHSLPPARTIVPVIASPSPQLQETSADPVHEQPEVKLDLGAVRLTFVNDSRHQLPQVVEEQQGMLALLDLKDNTIARYLVQPPAWEAAERIEDVSRSLRIFMDPPEEWAVFRNVASNQGIDLRQYRACALFDEGFRRCLKNAILAKASSVRGASGRVSSVLLAIAASQPCGIEVLEVSFAAR